MVPHRAGPGRGHAIFYELAWAASVSSTTSSWRGFGGSWRGVDGELAGAAPSPESSRKAGGVASSEAVGGVVRDLRQRELFADASQSNVIVAHGVNGSSAGASLSLAANQKHH